MVIKEDMIVTTTPTIEGFQIQEYFGTISSHVVAGTGFFHDFLASFSDFFGGRSSSYQSQLSSINEEAIDILKQKAISLGANSIVGLRIDHDQISGKNVQMFMITALGTAVIAKPLKKSENLSTKSKRLLSSNEIDILLKRKRIVELAKQGELVMDDEIWKFIIKNQVHEIVPNILVSLTNYSDNSSDNSYVAESKKKFRERCRQYFLNLPEEIAKKHIYSAMEENPGILQALMEIIDGSNIVDFGKIGDFLDPDYFLRGKNFLPLLTLNKSWYCTDDILIFENILDKIKNIFKMRAKLITEVSKFSHKIKKMWVCECGQKNRETQKYCSKCGNDIFGFKDDEIHPKEIQQSISQKIDILKEYFSVD